MASFWSLPCPPPVPMAWEPDVGWFPWTETPIEEVPAMEVEEVGYLMGRGFPVTGEGPDVDTPIDKEGEEPRAEEGPSAMVGMGNDRGGLWGTTWQAPCYWNAWLSPFCVAGVRVGKLGSREDKMAGLATLRVPSLELTRGNETE